MLDAGCPSTGSGYEERKVSGVGFQVSGGERCWMGDFLPRIDTDGHG